MTRRVRSRSTMFTRSKFDFDRFAGGTRSPGRADATARPPQHDAHHAAGRLTRDGGRADWGESTAAGARRRDAAGSAYLAVSAEFGHPANPRCHAAGAGAGSHSRRQSQLSRYPSLNASSGENFPVRCRSAAAAPPAEPATARWSRSRSMACCSTICRSTARTG